MKICYFLMIASKIGNGSESIIIERKKKLPLTFTFKKDKDFVLLLFFHTVRNLPFLSKNSTSTSENNFFGWKTHENVGVLDFLAVDNFDFTRKIVKKILVKNSWKCYGFVKIEFSDKNLARRIVCFTIGKNILDGTCVSL